MNTIKYSFIIATHNRNDDLQKCLSSIEKAHVRSQENKIEIIVVFNGENCEKSTLNTKDPILFKVYEIAEPGLSKARNFGIARSSGEYLVFIDDDATVKEDFVHVLNKCTISMKEKAFCGKILGLDGEACFSDIYMNNKIKYLGWYDQEYFRGSAHVVKKCLMEEIGGYNEKFGVGGKYCGAEDADLFFRLKQAKENIVYVPEMVFYHPLLEGFSSLKAYKYSYANGAVLIKQVLCDKIHFYIYCRIMLKELMQRTYGLLRNILFPKLMRNKNQKWQYNAAFSGMNMGIIDYIRFK